MQCRWVFENKGRWLLTWNGKLWGLLGESWTRRVNNRADTIRWSLGYCSREFSLKQLAPFRYATFLDLNLPFSLINYMIIELLIYESCSNSWGLVIFWFLQTSVKFPKWCDRILAMFWYLSPRNVCKNNETVLAEPWETIYCQSNRCIKKSIW